MEIITNITRDRRIGMDIFSLKPRNGEQVIAELESRYSAWKCASANPHMAWEYRFPDKGRIDVYKSNAIVFTGRHEDFCICRELDMRCDTQPIEGKGSPAISSLNFEHAVVGSDETGKGEVFRPFVMAAAYVRDEKELQEFLRMGVNDSKQIAGKIDQIGKAVTKINTWEEIMDQPFFVTDRFAVRVVSNEEYNRCCRERGGDDSEGVQHMQQEAAHMQILRALYGKHPESMVVVDDYTDGRGVKAFKDKLSAGQGAVPREKIFLTTKGDNKIIAVALASVISRYICKLAVDYACRQWNEVYKLPHVAETALPNGAAIAGGTEAFLRKLRPELREEFMDRYAKKYFENVRSAMKL